MNKPYDTALIVGRFNTLHKGHQKLIDTALTLCDRVLILVGSAQEVGTERNPLNINTRINMIREIYDDEKRVMIYAIPDMTNENDICADWGRFLLHHVDRYIYKNPEIMVYGNDEARSRWFDTEDIKQTTELIINRNELKISATMLRTIMVLNLRRTWMQFVDPKLHKMYDALRNELMTVPYYQNLEKKLISIIIADDKLAWNQLVDPYLREAYIDLKKQYLAAYTDNKTQETEDLELS